MSQNRHKTKYPGIYYRIRRRANGKEEKVYYCVWYDGHAKKIRESKAGGEYRDGMTAAKAANLRLQYIENRRPTPAQRRAEKKTNWTIQALWDGYKESLTNPGTRRTDTSRFDRFPQRVKESRPYELETEHVEKWDRQMIAEGYSPQTRKHSLSLLKRIIKWGVLHGHCKEPSNLIIKVPKVDNKKTEYLSDEQLASLLEALNADPDRQSAAAVELCLYTGIRRGALLALTWQDVDFERSFLLLRGETAKSGRTNTIPLSQNALEVLHTLYENRVTDNPLIFPSKLGKMQRELPIAFVKRIKAAASLPEGFRLLHGLRHSFAARLASSGKVDLYTLQRLMTHDSIESTQRYAHLLNEALKRAASIVDDVMTVNKN